MVFRHSWKLIRRNFFPSSFFFSLKRHCVCITWCEFQMSYFQFLLYYFFYDYTTNGRSGTSYNLPLFMLAMCAIFKILIKFKWIIKKSMTQWAIKNLLLLTLLNVTFIWHRVCFYCLCYYINRCLIESH